MQATQIAPASPPSKPEYLLRVYRWQTEEYMLIDWYNKLVSTGEMYTTFGADMRHMSTFLTFFRARVTMGYANDEKGIYFACWVEPFLSGGFFGVWIREDKRHTITALKLIKEAYTEAFKMCTVLIGICKQPYLAKVHAQLGYKKMGTVPALWNGEDTDVYTITKDSWRYGSR